MRVGTWQRLGPIVAPHLKQARANFLVSLGHPLAVFVFFVSLEPYGSIGQISQLLFVHASEELCVG
jgi:hypothetical protein